MNFDGGRLSFRRQDVFRHNPIDFNNTTTKFSEISEVFTSLKKRHWEDHCKRWVNFDEA